MSRITHFKIQPKNIQYWDYYILSRLNTDTAIVLQHIEYWDGTKSNGTTHGDDINHLPECTDEETARDTSRFFYKAQDELQWELMGLVGEKNVAAIIKTLTQDLKYLDQRNNPTNAMDRKKQYLFHDKIVQDHINYLAYIIDYFEKSGCRLNTVYYAIEQLTAAKVYIDTLSIAHVTDKLIEMHQQTEEDEQKIKEARKYKPVLPKFLRIQLNKDRGLLSTLEANKTLRFRNFAEWKDAKLRNAICQNCGMEGCKIAECNLQKRVSNSSNYNSNYNQQLQTEKRENNANTTNPNIVPNGTSPSFLSAQNQIAEMKARIEQLETLLQQSLGVTNANPSSPATNTEPNNTNMASGRNDNSSISVNDSIPAHSMENISTLEQNSRTDDAEIPIADLTTKNDDVEVSALAASSIPAKPTEKPPHQEPAKATQETLLDVPPGPPVMPHESAKWCPETIVQIVEAKLEHRFEEVLRGKAQKTQRQRQLIAAKKIIDAKITREEFIKAYDERNNEWWFVRNGELTVVDMASNTKNNVMRTLEVLENSAKKKAQPKNMDNVISLQERQRSSGSKQPVASARISEEAKNRNLERLRQRAVAAGYTE